MIWIILLYIVPLIADLLFTAHISIVEKTTTYRDILLALIVTFLPILNIIGLVAFISVSYVWYKIGDKINAFLNTKIHKDQ